MTVFSQLWDRLDRKARAGFIFFLIILTCLLAAASFWILRPNYQVLFGDLSTADAAAMTAELDRMKVPYQLENGGNTILVPAEKVYKTRLMLVGRDIPLHGSVGFELFNNSDMGMTEFAQKVNYQRALQGELTRTILSIEEIQSVRVHLALPEQALFKKNNSLAKASVSLALKPGKTLQARQVQGIQRLVAASVPDIHMEDVTVVDQHGIALTRDAGSSSESHENGGSNLDSKEAIEQYLARKVSAVLDKAFGAGESIASVDVVLNRDVTKVTTENVLGANDSGSAGVIVHDHQTTHNSASADAQSSQPQHAGDGSHDIDYQVGRRVEQVVSGPGGIEKINVAVVVKQQIDSEQQEHIRSIVAMAVGIDKDRGDGVAVYTVGQISAPHASPSDPISSQDGSENTQKFTSTPPDKQSADKPATSFKTDTIIYIVLTIGIVFFIFVSMLFFRRAPAQEPHQLSTEERDLLLVKVRSWLNEDPGKHGGQA